MKAIKNKRLKIVSDNEAHHDYTKTFRKNIANKRQGQNAFALSLSEESFLVRGFESVLKQCINPLIIQHPIHDIKLAIHKITGATMGYHMSRGEYIPQMLNMIDTYINKKDVVLDIGAGFGVSSALAGIKSASTVMAVEPQKNIHPVILENAKLNNANVRIIEACVTPENLNGQTEFHIFKNIMSSSIFMYDNIVEVSKKVKAVPLPLLIEQSQCNTIIIDALGAEIGIFQTIDLTEIHKIIVSVHTAVTKEQGAAHVINTLIRKGFELKDMKGHVYYFKRI